MITGKKITLKDFTERYTELLNNSSKTELIAILTAMANDIELNARQDFLAKLHPQKQEDQAPLKPATLVLDEIKDIKSKITDRAQEEPDWEYQEDEDPLCGYEEFIDPLTKIVDKVEAMFDYGHYIIARKAYEELFQIFDIEDDYGRGIRFYDLKAIDQNEAIARYFRSVYLTEKPDARVDTF